MGGIKGVGKGVAFVRGGGDQTKTIKTKAGIKILTKSGKQIKTK